MPDYLHDTLDPNRPERGVFGRRKGRPLSPERKTAIQDILPRIGIDSAKLTRNHRTTPRDIFGKDFPSYWMELGFGQGEHVTTLAHREPDTGFIGAEPFINGVSTLCKDLQQNYPATDNVRCLMDDGMIVAESLAPESLDGIYILNPDPWHKLRHHKRRIINQTNLDIFAHILKPNGMLVMTTDVEPLAEWMCTHAAAHPAFTWTAQTKADWQTRPKDWVTTRYEVKGAKGAKRMAYLFFRKNTV